MPTLVELLNADPFDVEIFFKKVREGDIFNEIYREAKKRLSKENSAFNEYLNKIGPYPYLIKQEMDAQLEDWRQFEQHFQDILTEQFHVLMKDHSIDHLAAFDRIKKNLELAWQDKRFLEYFSKYFEPLPEALKTVVNQLSSPTLERKEEKTQKPNKLFELFIQGKDKEFSTLVRDIYQTLEKRTFNDLLPPDQLELAFEQYLSKAFTFPLDTVKLLRFLNECSSSLVSHVTALVKKNLLQQASEEYQTYLNSLYQKNPNKKLLQKISELDKLISALNSSDELFETQLMNFNKMLSAFKKKRFGLLHQMDNVETQFFENTTCLLAIKTKSTLFSNRDLDLEWKSKSLNEIKILLRNAYFLASITSSDFLELATSSKEAADLILNNEALRKKLNTCNPAAQKQAFKNSCAAHSIMRALVEMKLIPPEEQTVSKELEIYRAIWKNPGEYADPQKIIQYLLQYPAVQVTRLTIDPFTSKKLTDSGPQKRPPVKGRKQLHESYSRFFNYSLTEMSNLHASQFFDEKQSEQTLSNNSLILIVICPARDYVPHVILGMSKGKQFKTIDPDNGKEESYSSFAQFMQHEEKFTGICYTLKQG